MNTEMHKKALLVGISFCVKRLKNLRMMKRSPHCTVHRFAHFTSVSRKVCKKKRFDMRLKSFYLV